MQQFAFGDFCFDATHGLLLRRGEPVDLGRRATLLLDCLLRRRGEVIAKADLVIAAWGDTAVEESNLSVQIGTLRRVLGRDDTGREWITTIERVGYRFLPPPARPSQTGFRSLPTLVVRLDSDAPGVSSRVAEAESANLVACLSLFSWLQSCGADVPPALVDYRLVGAVQDIGDERQARLRLVEAATGRTLWADSIDLNAPTSSIDPRCRIAATVEARLHAAEIERSCIDRPNSSAAYDCYLRGRAKLRSSRPEDNAAAYALFFRAVEAEPGNPIYLSAIAETLHHRSVVGWPDLTGNDLRLKLDFARRGWEASEFDAISLSLVGNAMFTSGEPETGLVLTERAAEMNPASPLVLGCAALGQLWIGDLDRAADYFQRGIALNPSDPNQRFSYGGLSCVLHLRGELQSALETARRGYALSPGYSGNQWRIMVASLELGRDAEAARRFSVYREIHPDSTLASIRNGQPFGDERRMRPLTDALRTLGLPAN